MVKRTVSYERVFEEVLRSNGVLYLAIDERRRPIHEDKAVKNFDFLVSSFNGKFLVDVKGKKFPYGRRGYWENWITRDDLNGLATWAKHLTATIPLLVYVYHVQEKADLTKFRDLVHHEGQDYGIVAVELSVYFSHAKPRSTRWKALSVPSQEFQMLCKPTSHFIPELGKKW